MTRGVWFDADFCAYCTHETAVFHHCITFSGRWAACYWLLFSFFQYSATAVYTAVVNDFSSVFSTVSSMIRYQDHAEDHESVTTIVPEREYGGIIIPAAVYIVRHTTPPTHETMNMMARFDTRARLLLCAAAVVVIHVLYYTYDTM